MIASSAVGRPPRRRWPGRTLIGVLGGGVLAAIGVLGTAGYVQRVSRPYLFTVESAPSVPVALVLGAEVSSDGRPSPFLRGRLDVAKDLWDAGKIKVIIVSGDNGTSDYDEPTAMRDYLITAGVPADQVVADFAGFDTYDSCYRARDIFGVSRVVMISQDYHLPRSVVTCRALGLDAIAVGDGSARAYPAVWRYGERREMLANLKMIFDLVTRRLPVLGARESSVDDALR